MRIHRKANTIFPPIFLGGLLLLILIMLTTPCLKAANHVEVRDDGLTIVIEESTAKESKTKHDNDYLTMIIKTGYAYDPDNKIGITVLTNEILYLILRFSSAVTEFETYPDFTVYRFRVSHNDYHSFCKELDAVIRMDALMFHDLCNELIQMHQNEPRVPSKAAYDNLIEMLYGKNHPYFTSLKANYQNLNINDVNSWFRKVYQPKNIIISSSENVPDDFLRRPTGRNMNETVSFDKIDPVNNKPVPGIKFTPIHDNLGTVDMGFLAPKMGEEGFFAAVLVEDYLSKELWDRVREEAGLCYDLRVEYTFLSRSSAPALEIKFQTLPEDTGKAINIVIEVLNNLAKDGIPEGVVSEIINRKKKKMDLITGSPLNVVENNGYDAFYNQKWLSNSIDYIDLLTKNSNTVSQVIAEKLTSLKISVAGPEEIGDDITGFKQEITSFEKSVK